MTVSSTSDAGLTRNRRRGSAEDKFLTFKLAGQHYGVPILKVQEIIGLMPITPVPHVGEEVRGVINLRGKVITVVDLRVRFGFQAPPDDKLTCIVVVQVETDDATLTMGVIVDAVSAVQDITASQIEPPPSYGHDLDARFIKGVGKVDRQVIMLLDIERILSREQTQALIAAAEDD